ncbi:hypothetical protein [Xanthomonas sp. 10-10]|uniref:Transmembrane protein n=1 Tax=Xanthomonas sp. 10-10 TaxID=3115848 RepID=A0AAU7PDV0_9XANT
MDGVTIGLAVGGISALLGLYQHGYIARHRLSTESFDSPVRWQRWTNRYLIFSLHFFLAFFLTPVLINFMDMDATAIPVRFRIPAYLIACMPLALLFFHFDLWFMRRCDQTKRDARERAQQYLSRL